MKQPVIIVGVGELGGIFAKGFLRCGYPVYPVTRETNLDQAASQYPEPELVLLAVAENDFPTALKTLPEAWRSKLLLLQNELLPDDWISRGIEQPTVISVWFEKKKGQDIKVLLPSPIFGPDEKIISAALASMEIPTTKLSNLAELTNALVMKNVFVFTINIVGLVVGGTTGKLLEKHRGLTEKIFDDIMTIQESLCGEKLDRPQVFLEFSRALLADPEHKCKGRSAIGRLNRSLETAKLYEVLTPALNKVQITCSRDS